MQKPIDGMYRTRSATTNPTGKNKFDAGINGKTMNDVPCVSIELKTNKNALKIIARVLAHTHTHSMVNEKFLEIQIRFRFGGILLTIIMITDFW